MDDGKSEGDKVGGTGRSMEVFINRPIVLKSAANDTWRIPGCDSTPDSVVQA